MAFGIKMNLEVEGYDVAVAESGRAALRLHASFGPELILLDLKLPDIDGLEVLRRIRGIDPQVRIVIVSCLAEPEDRVAGFIAGANDYQVKPFAIAELLRRVHSQFESASLPRKAEWHRDPDHLFLDPPNRTVHFRSKVFALAEKPFALLQRLVEADGDCVTRATLLREIWHFRVQPQTHTLEQHIASLRRLLNSDSATPVILTVHRRGYRINPVILPAK